MREFLHVIFLVPSNVITVSAVHSSAGQGVASGLTRAIASSLRAAIWSEADPGDGRVDTIWGLRSGGGGRTLPTLCIIFGTGLIRQEAS